MIFYLRFFNIFCVFITHLSRLSECIGPCPYAPTQLSPTVRVNPKLILEYIRVIDRKIKRRINNRYFEPYQKHEAVDPQKGAVYLLPAQ